MDTDLSADHVILHDYSKDFETFCTPGNWPLYCRSHFGFWTYPQNWANKIEKEFDQLWVYYRLDRTTGAGKWHRSRPRSGRSDSVLIPSFFDRTAPSRLTFHPMILRFSSSGAPSCAKELIRWIRAYESAFSASDNVSLVVKGNSQNLHYQGFNDVEEILAESHVKDPPNIVHIDDHLDSEELAAIVPEVAMSVCSRTGRGLCLANCRGNGERNAGHCPQFRCLLGFLHARDIVFRTGTPNKAALFPYFQTGRGFRDGSAISRFLRDSGQRSGGQNARSVRRRPTGAGRKTGSWFQVGKGPP